MNLPEASAPPTVRQLSEALASGELDAESLTHSYIARIQAQPDAAVFISTTFERAYEEAAASARRYRSGTPLGPLDGIPVAWKDNIDVAGVVTTAGSDLLRGRPPASVDADVVARLSAAGMVTLGKLNMSEFAYSALGLNPHFGTPLNPRSHGAARVPGGSSSGSGVAVARGMVPIAIGTDTGGSVRVPASFNGVVGYKPSEARFSVGGVFELSRTLDTIGVFAHSVEDCELVDAAMRGLKPGPKNPVPAWKPRFADIQMVVPTNMPTEWLQPAVADNFHMALRIFEDLGVKVSREALPELDAIQALGAQHGFMASAEAYCCLHDLLEGPESSRITPFVYRRMMAGKEMSAYDLLRLQQGRRRLQACFWERIGSRLLAMPTTLHVAPLLKDVEEDIECFTLWNSRSIRHTLWGNMLNACGVSIPNGRGEGGMPTGLLLSAGPQREQALLECCRALEPYLAAHWQDFRH